MQEWINALKIYKKTFNFFSIGERMSKKKSSPQKKKKTAEEIEWEKACEAERNFQKAVDMATGFLPVRSEEDRKFMEKWIFL